MKYKVGFIGCGNMASAIIGGLINNANIKASEIIAADASETAIKKASDKLNINTTLDNKEVASSSEVLFLSVKPQFYETVIAEIKDTISDNQIVVTIAPGKTLAWLAKRIGNNVKIVRTMPNTPALVGEGITAVCKNSLVNEEEFSYIMSLLKSFGLAEEISENLMDVVVSVSGSSPAYVFMFIEAMADAAVLDGMPRDKAYKFAAQAVLGSAKMVIETGKHPGELKDMVCSPAGTTIEAVRVLEEKGFRSSVIEAMKACTDKSKSL
ncbi:MAG: pyrroline-5-carboxylate reductase [Lachnospiraceae bacterium]|nr:pyrroline-5-carboxylate reductase [Lachnospiraceae bacterium]MBR1815613.1 pyrroline-5-carboxylate reductase [Lachnospiraceae bacterium]